MRRNRAALIAAAVCTLPLLPLVPLAAQAARPAVGGGFTLTPHVGFTSYTDLAEFGVHDASDPTFVSFDVSGRMKFETQLTLGVTGAYQPATSRWGAFGDFSRSSGHASVAARYCFDDPDLGPQCDALSLGLDGSQWRLAAGVTHRSTLSTATATLSLGALYGKTTFSSEDPDTGERSDATESNPGVLLGAALEFPLSRRVGLRLDLSDAVMRISNDSFGDVTGGGVSGVTVTSDPKIANALSFGAGVVLRF